ncbi:uncharacterized protein V1510DRAFT_324815 [Dipodascopsis tothii]|uniref:uncharacterized protein n=1 Tax=Dipodascopsis tothii TaxID=44089 RepID=UPI0034CF6B21
MSEKSNLYLYSVPPSYDESELGSAPSGSGSRPRGTGPSTAEEREGFLAGDDAAAADSARASLSSLVSDGDAELRREIQQFEIIEPADMAAPSYRRTVSARMATSLRAGLQKLRHIPGSLARVRVPDIPLLTPLSVRWKTQWSRAGYAFDQFQLWLDARLARWGNPMLIRRLAFVLLFSVVILLVVSAGIIPFGVNDGTSPYPSGSQEYDVESLKQFFLSKVSHEELAKRMDQLTEFPHMTGTQGDYILKEYLEKEMTAMGLEVVEADEYAVYLNHPDRSRQSLVMHEPYYEAVLGEPDDDDDDDDDDHKDKAGDDDKDHDTAGGRGGHPAGHDRRDGHRKPHAKHRRPFPFHALSAAGNVTGHLVYANYATERDFAALQADNVPVAGAVVLCRYGVVHESLKVRAAELAGAVGVIMFRDKLAADEPSYPAGRSIPEDAVQRGAVALRNWQPGDVLTPEWASTPTARRIDLRNSTAVPHIPSLPVSWADAKHFLAALEGHGTRAGPTWQPVFPATAYTGAAGGPVVTLVNDPVVREQQPMWDVVGKIGGLEQSDMVVILGAHRDSWCVGASDAMSGTAVMLEIARIFGHVAQVYAWRPLRTVLFASWDGTEQNLIGSTEWAEQNAQLLRENGAVYVNLDQAVAGAEFRASGNPGLQELLLSTLAGFDDPRSGEALRKLWGDRALPPLEGDRDTLPFQSFAGVASLDLGFADRRGYPTRTCADSLDWIERFGDPAITPAAAPDARRDDHAVAYSYHKLLTQIVGVIMLRLCNEMVLPLDYTVYGAHLATYLTDLAAYADGHGVTLDMGRMAAAVPVVDEAAAHMRQWEKAWEDETKRMPGMETAATAFHRWSHNTRLMNFDKHLLDLGGLPGRPWFKHVLYGPQLWPPTVQDPAFASGAVFAAVRDAVHAGEAAEAQRLLDQTAEILMAAARKLAN